MLTRDLPFDLSVEGIWSCPVPAEKIKRLKTDLSQKVQNLKHVTDFISDYGGDATSWSGEKIIKRANDMALKAYREVWKIG